MLHTRRALLCCCSIIAWAACFQAADARWPDGVLNYCGFEGSWDEAGWRDTQWGQGGTPGIAFDRQTKRFGKASLRIEGDRQQSRSAMHLTGCGVQSGKQYVLRFWIKTKDLDGEATVTLLPHSEGKPLPWINLGDASHVRAAHDWTLVEITVPQLSKEIDRLYTYLSVKGSGVAWFDEFSLAEAGVDVPLGGQKPITEADYAGVRFDDSRLPENLLKNSGFELGLNDWYVESGKPRIDDKIAANARHSLRLDGFPECNYSILQIHVKIDPHRAYRLSLKLKTQLRAGLSCVQLLPLKSNGEPIGFFTQDHTSEFCHGRGTQDWHEESILLRQFAPETNSVHLLLRLQDALGTVWFDELRLTPLSLIESQKVQKP